MPRVCLMSRVRDTPGVRVQKTNKPRSPLTLQLQKACQEEHRTAKTQVPPFHSTWLSPRPHNCLTVQPRVRFTARVRALTFDVDWSVELACYSSCTLSCHYSQQVKLLCKKAKCCTYLLYMLLGFLPVCHILSTSLSKHFFTVNSKNKWNISQILLSHVLAEK